MKNDLEVGARIRSIREELHLSRDRFSEELGISEAFLGQIERGERSVSIPTLIKIREHTGYTTDYILFGEIEENLLTKKINRIANRHSEKELSFIYDFVRLTDNFCKKLDS